MVDIGAVSTSVDLIRSVIDKFAIRETKKLPAKIGEAIDKLYEIRTERLNLEKAVGTLDGLEKLLAGHITDLLKAQTLESSRGDTATFTRTWKTVPKLEDEKKFVTWLQKNKHNPFDFLSKSLRSGHISDLWNDKKVVPGVDGIRIETYSLTRAAAK